ncbi:reverse transcriptase domain-containing protein [Tanacetum coccineum]
MGFARALIEVEADKNLNEEIIMSVPRLEEEGHNIERMRVEYEWKPPRCSECLVFGHDTSECPKCVVKPTKESTEAGDGFTMVQNRKKKGKSVVNRQIRHADGFRPSKPKPKYAWSVKQNQNNNAEIKVTYEEFTMKLKNHFSALHDDNVVVPSKVTGASSSGVFNDGDLEKLIPTSLDTDSEVEDLGNEYDVVKTSKGASTPSDEFPNV